MSEENTSTDEAPVAAPAASAASAASATAAVAESPARVNRKVREGTVVSNKMDKTLTVAVIERDRHPKYGKFMMRTKKLYAHDETNDANIGDKVRVMETRPLSKNKRWRLVEILERAK
jgi:small subunit ribosomal protein S17